MKGSDLYRLFFEEASDALVAVSLADGQLLSVNGAFVALSGFAREELEGESLSILNSNGQSLENRDRSLDLEILENPGFYNDIALSTRDGDTKYLSVKVRHIQIEKKKIALAVLSDDTARQILMRDLATKHQFLEQAYSELDRTHSELKSTQDKMIQASKLVALGELAAGMSHELNQPLTGIRGYAQEVIDLLKAPKPSKKEAARLCTEIVTNADKMANLLSHLRDFARRKKQSLESGEEVVPVNAVEVIANATKLLDRQFKNHNITLEIRGTNSDVFVLGQTHPFEQILINLLTNARDAIVDRRNRDPNLKGTIIIQLDQEGDQCVFRVTDNGGGIPESIKTQIFDPFFSTKEQSHGMGLGLSISFGLAHKFHGELVLESSNTSGTTFALKFNLATAAKKKLAA